MNYIRLKNHVSKDRLIHHVEKEKLDAPKNKMLEMIKKIGEEKPALLEDLYSEYEHAGKISINVFELIDYPEVLKNKQSFLSHIKNKLSIETKIVGVNFNWDLSPDPQIRNIKEIKDGFIIEWVEGIEKDTDPVGSYEPEITLQPKFTTMTIHIASPLFIEIRAGYNPSRKFLKVLKKLLSNNEQAVEFKDIPLTKVSESEAKQIATILDAGLLDAEHLGNGGIGRYSVSAAPEIRCLRDVKEYNDNFSGKQYLTQTLRIDYKDTVTGYTTVVKFKLNMNGGFEFKSRVSEKIINSIFDVFYKVRYTDKASGE